MNSTDSILQCEACCRQHDGNGAVVALRFGVPQLVPCGRGDCGTVASALALEESSRVERDKQKVWKPFFDRRRLAIQERAQASGNGGHRPPLQASGKHGKHRAAPVGDARPQCRTAPVRQMLAASEDEFNASDEQALEHVATENTEAQRPLSGGNVGAARQVRAALANRPTGATPAAVDGASRQASFVASGVADSANKVLLEFFSLPHNFGLWFKSTVLEALTASAGHPSSRMNNRAVDLRPVFIERGLYIDQCNIRDEHTQKVASCYRVCAIGDILDAEKRAQAQTQFEALERH